MTDYYPPQVTISCYSVFTAVSIALTALRYWCRVFYGGRARLGLDDHFILAGVCILIGIVAMQIYNSVVGTSGNAIDSDENLWVGYVSRRVDFAMTIVEKPMMGAIKLSLLFTYNRIFGVWDDFRRINNALIVLVVVWTVAFTFANLFICGSKVWLCVSDDQELAAEECADKALSLLLFAVTSFISDIVILALPFFFMRRLQIARDKKLAAGAMFLLGFISAFACLLRMVFLAVSYPLGRVDWDYHPKEGEITPLVLSVFNPTFWIIVEAQMAIWAADIPALGPLLRNSSFSGCCGLVYRKINIVTTNRGGSSSSRVQRPGIQSRTGTEVMKNPFKVHATSVEEANGWASDETPIIPMGNMSGHSLSDTTSKKEMSDGGV